MTETGWMMQGISTVHLAGLLQEARGRISVRYDKEETDIFLPVAGAAIYSKKTLRKDRIF